jgi:hypothetical protein
MHSSNSKRVLYVQASNNIPASLPSATTSLHPYMQASNNIPASLPSSLQPWSRLSVSMSANVCHPDAACHAHPPTLPL